MAFIDKDQVQQLFMEQSMEIQKLKSELKLKNQELTELREKLKDSEHLESTS